jgi:hypothetical protein
VGHVHNFSNLVPHYVCVDAAEECVPEPCGSGGWPCLAPLAQPQPGGPEFSYEGAKPSSKLSPLAGGPPRTLLLMSAVRPRRLQRLGLWSRWHALEPHCLQRPARGGQDGRQRMCVRRPTCTVLVPWGDSETGNGWRQLAWRPHAIGVAVA